MAELKKLLSLSISRFEAWRMCVLLCWVVWWSYLSRDLIPRGMRIGLVTVAVGWFRRFYLSTKAELHHFWLGRMVLPAASRLPIGYGRWPPGRWRLTAASPPSAGFCSWIRASIHTRPLAAI